MRQRLLGSRFSAIQEAPGGSLRSQRGQAVTEYLLILIVVVGIALGVLYQLNTAFKKYVQSYFGEYVACLLETGEMPSMGGGDGVNTEICAASFEPFSLSNGRPLSGGGGSGSGDGSGNMSGSSSDGGKKRYGRESSSRTGSARMGKGRATPNAERLNSGNTTVSSVDSKGKGASKATQSQNVASGRFRFRTSRMGSDDQIALSSKFYMNTGKDKADSSPTIKKVASKKDPSASASRKLAVNIDAFNRKDEKAPEVGLEISAGDWLRYLLIFAILIGIFVFFGGQLNQLRKSWDNN